MTETLTKIWNVLKSVEGIFVSSVAIIAIGSSALLRHDAKVIKAHTDSIEVRNDMRFTAIENRMTDLTVSVNISNEIYNSNFLTVKTQFQNHLQKSKDIKPDERLNDILNIVNGIYTEVKKNGN